MALPDGVSKDSNRAIYETLLSGVGIAPGSSETKINAATIPAGGVGFVGWLSAIWYQLTQFLKVQGSSAAAAADDGLNPVKIGVVYKAPVTQTLGNRVELITDSQQNLRVSIAAVRTATARGVSNANVGFASDQPSTVSVLPGAAQYGNNGASWDPVFKPNGTKILPSAAASTNADFAKASAGELWCISGFNAAAAVRYLKLFNKASAPTVGTDTPIMVIALPVGAFNLNMGGHYFSTGVAFALTTGAALLDTGALTAADIVGLTLTFS